MVLAVVGVAGLCVAISAAVIDALAGGGTARGTAIEDVLRVTAVLSVVVALGITALRGGRGAAAYSGSGSSAASAAESWSTTARS
jgi:hypothetical protein